MNRNKKRGVTKAWFWLQVLIRHFFRQPGLLIPYIGILAGTLCLTAAGLHVPTEIRAAVCTDGSAFSNEVLQALDSRDMAVQFYLCDSEEQMMREIASGKAECGYLLDDKIRQQLDACDLQKEYPEDIIAAFSPPKSLVSGIADELFFAGILSVYSPQYYADYMAEVLAGEGTEQKDTAQKARMTYEIYQNNQSTFAFQFSGAEETEDSSGQTDQRSILRIRGILAVMIQTGALCAAASHKKDCALHRFLCVRHPWTVKIASYMIAVTAACLTGLMGLWLSGEWTGWFPELTAMAFYGFLLIGYCLLTDWLLPSEAWMVSFIPLAAAASLILAPVFVDLSQVLPVIKILRLGTPVSVYLRLIG